MRLLHRLLQAVVAATGAPSETLPLADLAVLVALLAGFYMLLMCAAPRGFLRTTGWGLVALLASFGLLLMGASSGILVTLLAGLDMLLVGTAPCFSHDGILRYYSTVGGG